MSDVRQYWGHVVLGLAVTLWIAQLFLPDQGVGFVTGLVVFLMAWWMVFFTTLPLQVTSQSEAGEIVPGTEPGAPNNPRLGLKMWLTTRITAGFWLIFFLVFEFGLITADMFSFAAPQGAS